MNQTNAPQARELTFGEKACGVNFNPDGNPEVAAIKQRFADLIDDLHQRRLAYGAVNEQGRMLSIAITEAQTAQMWAIKAITWSHH
jgi:hypothetical protein